jgi:hypothetical protein
LHGSKGGRNIAWNRLFGSCVFYEISRSTSPFEIELECLLPIKFVWKISTNPTTINWVSFRWTMNMISRHKVQQWTAPANRNLLKTAVSNGGHASSQATTQRCVSRRVLGVIIAHTAMCSHFLRRCLLLCPSYFSLLTEINIVASYQEREPTMLLALHGLFSCHGKLGPSQFLQGSHLVETTLAHACPV